MQQIKRSSGNTIDFSSSSNWRWTKLFLSVLGAWPLQSPTNRCILTTVTSIVIGSMFIPEVLKLITIRKNVDEILICLPYITLHMIAITVVVNLSLNSRMIKILILQIRKDWQHVIHESEKEIIRNEQQDHEKILTSYIIYMSFVTMLYFIAPLLPMIFDHIKPLNESRPRIFVYHTQYFLDEKKYDVPKLIHTSIFTPFPTMAVVAFDTMFATSIQHACSIFKIVGKRLQFLMDHKEHQRSRQDFSILPTEIRKTMVESIRIHVDILQFVDHLQAAFSTSLFIMNFMSMMNLSMTAYQVLNNLHNTTEIVRLGFYTVGQLIRLYFRCWHGQILMNSSESTYVSLYQGDWYNLPFQLRQFIVLILLRGKKQSRITAGKVYDMSMENFTFVVKTAMSYVAVLRSVQ